VIVAVGSDKGAPGATTLTVLLGLVWPYQSLVLELDLRGASLPYRMQRFDGQPLARTPSVASLALAARPGSPPPQLETFAQPTSLGVPVVAGLVGVPNEVDGTGQVSGPRARATLARYLPGIAAAGQQWTGTAIADVGELLPGNPAVGVAKAAEVTLLVTRPSTEGLGRLWERASELIEALGNADRSGPPLGIVLVAEDAKVAEARAKAVLDLVGCPAPVVGTLAWDARGAAQLWAGGHRQLAKSPLYRSAQRLVDRIVDVWPESVAGSSGLPRLTGHPAPRTGLWTDDAAQPARAPLLGWSAVEGGRR
jgi:hypothetical protein